MSVPAVPEPDGKDWTWTLTRPCPECGFDGPGMDRADVPALTLIHTATLNAALAGSAALRRPEPTTWSPLEYGCHVRDVCVLFRERLRLMLTEDDPEFANWDQDATALEDRYWDQDPESVSWELRSSADEIADAFALIRDDDWTRTGRRSNGSAFTVETFARYFVHDLAHHAWDVTHER